MSWQELLYRRLTGLLGDVGSRGGTTAAEAALRFPNHMVYYYVGRCVPAFGYNAFASHPVAPSSLTTPFDTGALVDPAGYISTSPELDEAARIEFVRKYSYEHARYVPPMNAWLEVAFPTPTAYVDGARPLTHAAPEVVLAECRGDSRVWTWEARLPAVDYPQPPVAASRVYFGEGTREPYLDWVGGSTLITAAERMQHIQDVYLYSEEVGDAATAMVDHLRGELVR